jgi:very-short-patch-repair endonuclease
LRSEGFTVLRFDNSQVLNGSDHVFTAIEKHVTAFLKKKFA